MDIVIGKRDALFCNLRILLIVLVVYGHLIENEIWNSEMLLWQYRLIYAVHMPLFAFASGVFLNGKKTCFLQMKKALTYYLLFQMSYILHMKIFQNTEVSLTEPYWHLWYLLSLGSWALICLGLEFLEMHFYTDWIKVLLVFASILIACAAGMVVEIDRRYSLSRTIVFLPYVLMGKYFPKERNIHKYRWRGLLAGIFAVGLLVILAPVLPVSFLYQADSYMARGVEHGVLLRFLTYIIGFGLGFCILVFIPQKRLPLSKMGANTLWIYVLHASMVLCLRELRLWEKEFPYIAGFVAIAIVLFLYKCFQWKGRLYQIISIPSLTNRKRTRDII